MKTSRFFCIILIGAILLPGCASTTLLTTVPDGSDVYIAGIKEGKTPFYYTDTKPAFSTTSFTFKKDGYDDLNVMLKRNEAVDVGSFFGGLFLIVPYLWITKYDPVHTYPLVISDKSKQFGSGVVDYEDSTIAVNEIVINENDSLKKEPEFTPETTQLNDSIYIENDSLTSLNSEPAYSYDHGAFTYFGVGGGVFVLGSVWGLSYSMVTENLWGANIRAGMNICKTEAVPHDYWDDGKRVFHPKDYINTVSLNLVKLFSLGEKRGRYGFELGPSWVIYRKAEFEYNPGYDPDYIYGGYLYEKSHPRQHTIGLSLRGKTEILTSQSGGLELSVFTCINKYKSIFGFELSFLIGDMGNR